VPDRLEETNFEHESFDGYTILWEVDRSFLRGCEAGGGTGFVKDKGILGGIMWTVGEFIKDWGGEIEGEAEVGELGTLGGVIGIATATVDWAGDKELTWWLRPTRAPSLKWGNLLVIGIVLDKVIQRENIRAIFFSCVVEKMGWVLVQIW
jgi:hypothetical protein